jgi:methyl-accepting chemotaxis protein
VQRRKTDNAIKELYYLAISLNFKFLGDDIKKNLEISFAKLNRIEDKRKGINQLKLSVAEEISYYTKIVDSLLMGIKHLSKAITHAELFNKIVTYVNILQAKEKAGIERATLNNVLSRGYFAPDMYKKFILLAGLQEVYLKTFFFFATPRQRKYYIETMQAHEKLETEVKRIRTIALKKAYKVQLIMALHVHLGYGGLIHQFKNYVRRKKIY